jgi:hypothetical protein
MEFVIVAAIGCLIFALCFAVLALKSRKEGPSAKLHMCAHGGECRCETQQCPDKQSDLQDQMDQMETAKSE